ncbi:Uncharacterised protein [Mycobacteroides abscessus subsp. abscessus]|nr:Uncharacterised protein [Mycobacteroides abscessus subsp. abscessus]SKT94886.1 Uncharacterised protein [Mycobacteroides abscessus subsp. abscessus]
MAAPSGGSAASRSAGSNAIPVVKNSGSAMIFAPARPASAASCAHLPRFAATSPMTASSWIAAASTINRTLL